VWLNSSGSIDREWSYSDLYDRTCTLSLHLKHDLKLQKGDRAILCFVPGLEFFVAFWACVSQGIIAVPVAPVDPFNPRSDSAEKLAAIVSTCQPQAFLTTSEYVSAIDAGRTFLEASKPTSGAAAAVEDEPLPFDLYGTEWILTDTLDYSQEFDPHAPFDGNNGSGMQLAFLQFTSGSTGAPKGVMVSCGIAKDFAGIFVLARFSSLILSSSPPPPSLRQVGHANIVANIPGCTESTRAGKDFDQYRKTVAVSWLPTFHDSQCGRGRRVRVSAAEGATGLLMSSPLVSVPSRVRVASGSAGFPHRSPVNRYSRGLPLAAGLPRASDRLAVDPDRVDQRSAGPSGVRHDGRSAVRARARREEAGPGDAGGEGRDRAVESHIDHTRSGADSSGDHPQLRRGVRTVRISGERDHAGVRMRGSQSSGERERDEGLRDE
jgi:hypothetical protein